MQRATLVPAAQSIATAQEHATETRKHSDLLAPVLIMPAECEDRLDSHECKGCDVDTCKGTRALGVIDSGAHVSSTSLAFVTRLNRKQDCEGH